MNNCNKLLDNCLMRYKKIIKYNKISNLYYPFYVIADNLLSMNKNKQFYVISNVSINIHTCIRTYILYTRVRMTRVYFFLYLLTFTWRFYKEIFLSKEEMRNLIGPVSKITLNFIALAPSNVFWFLVNVCNNYVYKPVIMRVI